MKAARMESQAWIRVKWLPALLVFAIGLPLGWLLRDADLSDRSSFSPFFPKPVARHGSTAGTGAEERWNNFASGMMGAGGPDWKDLPPGDRAAALRAMIDLTGPRRHQLDRHLEKTMGEVLKEWATDDLEGALSAARDTSNEDLRQFMIDGIKRSLIGKDLDKLLALEQEFPQRRMRFGVAMVHQGVMATLEQGAEKFIAALEKAPASGGTGIEGKFPADFDFEFAADGMARVMASIDSPTNVVCPTNFFREWAKQDADAAFSWWLANEPLPFSNLGDLISVPEGKSPEDAAAWLAAKIQQPAIDREKIIRELGREYPEVLSVRISAIAQAMRDTGASDVFLTDFLRLNSHPDLDRQYTMAFVFSSMSSPAARLAAIQTIRDREGYVRIDHFTNEQFASWGISREQATSILTRE
ncbi:MAG: hypothetical protein EOP87_06925 [Verrucomicrobiaceae bacterium]|nr:MAG: hypothetical protein EOP87_06925 [Verrucomicrobiaceae bacterium]